VTQGNNFISLARCNR